MLVIAVLQLRAASQNVAQTAVRTHAECLVNARAAQVGVNQQYAHTLLSQDDRGIDARRRLTFLGQSTRDNDDFRRRAQVREQTGKSGVRDRTPPSATAGALA